IKGNYKPARGNYLLGEVAFAQKRYEDAIYYYKTSATRYDKADYMPRLMLNSAKSFNAIKEKENAKRFLETLISLYPKFGEF
ncbi:tetratricopeptide repeat protein, partial [Helicobacter sp. UBA3407]|uniref:tetratricopeptide repeat protein n=1 Tax=Helicobacter sp. UBA3407 TaxID=1946588 RepID=UPI002616EEF5